MEIYMKSLKNLLEQLIQREVFFIESEESKGWKYKAMEPKQQARTRVVGNKVRADADAAAKKERQQKVAAKEEEAKQTEGKAAKWGIPYIKKMAQDSDKIVSVSVDGHDSDGKIWFHHGVFHFRHPSGKIHNEITLDKSAKGIAVMPKVKPGQKVVKAIAHLPPSRDAIEDDDFIQSGKTLKKK